MNESISCRYCFRQTEVRQIVALAIAFLADVIIGGGGLWIAIHPGTCTVPTWLKHSGNSVTVAAPSSLGDVGAPPPIVRLSRTPGAAGWKLIVRGKEMADSKERTLDFLSQVSNHADVRLSIQPDEDVDMETLRSAMNDLKGLGFHHFQIQGIL